MAKCLTWDGGIAAVITGSLFWEAGGWQWALPLLVFFVTSVSLSFWRREQKRLLGLGSPRRGWHQVAANGGVPTLMASLSLLSESKEPWFTAAVASLASANADTWATEIGAVLGKRFFFIPNFQPAQAGEEGAVSIAGLLGGVGGSLVVAMSALPWLCSFSFWLVCFLGVLGSIVDSLLGSTYERQGRLSNDGVNILSAGSTASLALLFTSCLFG